MDSSTEEEPTSIIFGDESLSDVTLVVDQQEFKIHKMALACRSDVFKAMFYGYFKESKETRIEIKDVSVDSFRRLLEIMYTGKTSDATSFLQFPFYYNCHFDIYITNEDPTNEDPISNSVHYTPSYKQFFQPSWEAKAEMLKIADRFNITSLVKDYLGSVIAFDIKHCDRKECHQCFNSFIFALINGLDVSKCQKIYPKQCYHTWINYAGEKPFPEMVPVKVVQLMHQKFAI